MRSLLARLALVGLVGIALAGCGTSNGTPLPNGAFANNAGGGAINTTPGVGAPPLGSVASLLIDNGNVTAAYVGFNAPTTDAQNVVSAFQDPVSAAVISVPASPSGATLAQGAPDAGSHAVQVGGNGLTQTIFRFNGAVPNLSFPFGLPGNAVPFTMSQIVTHFSFGLKANGAVTIAIPGGVPTAGDTVFVFVSTTGCTGAFSFAAKIVTGGDTAASIAATLRDQINANATFGPTVAAGIYSYIDPVNSAIIRLAATTNGTAANGTATTGVCFFGFVAGATETATPVAPTFLAGGAASTTANLGTFSSWSLELVGNLANAGPGAPANTYDVRVACAATAVGNSLNRFVCGPLPVYGALPTGTPGAPAAVGAQPGTYSPPVTNPVAPGAAGAFTPINPQMYIVNNYTTATTVTTAATGANPWIDYIYAAQ